MKTCSFLTALLFLLSTITAQSAPSDRLVDVGIIVDVSGSFVDDLARFRNQSTAIVSLIQATYPNALFGLATFQDYPFAPWGSPNDKPHRLVQNLGPSAPFIAAVKNITATGGGDFPESQLAAVYQSITGLGQVVASGIAKNYTIPPKQNFSFRTGSARVILLWTDATFHTPNITAGYPGPTFAQVVAAAIGSLTPVIPVPTRHLKGSDDSKHRYLQEQLGPDAIRIIGIVSDVNTTQIPQLAALANATGGVAGPGGLDCDDNGSIDIPAGKPIVCFVGAGLTSVIVKVVEEIVPSIPKVTNAPTKAPTKTPTKAPTKVPTKAPTMVPAKAPTKAPTSSDTAPVAVPVAVPVAPAPAPVIAPVGSVPVPVPVQAPVVAPIQAPVKPPTRGPCGLFRLSILCFNGCGIVGRLLGLCKK